MEKLTLEGITNRLEGLKNQRQQLFDNLNAVGGAIQLCEQLIKELTEDAPKPIES